MKEMFWELVCDSHWRRGVIWMLCFTLHRRVRRVALSCGNSVLHDCLGFALVSHFAILHPYAVVCLLALLAHRKQEEVCIYLATLLFHDRLAYNQWKYCPLFGGIIMPLSKVLKSGRTR